MPLWVSSLTLQGLRDCAFITSHCCMWDLAWLTLGVSPIIACLWDIKGLTWEASPNSSTSPVSCKIPGLPGMYPWDLAQSVRVTHLLRCSVFCLFLFIPSPAEHPSCCLVRFSISFYSHQIYSFISSCILFVLHSL